MAIAEEFNVEIKLDPEYRTPTIMGYNRLESRSRSRNFDKSLRAEVRDALWMLTRQWQTGEFIAEDAGSAAKIKMLSEKTSIYNLALRDQPSQAYNSDIPLETRVEREMIPPDLSLRVEMGKYFRLLMKKSLIAHYDILLSQYKLSNTISPEDFEKIKLDNESLQFFKLIKERALDGFKIYTDILEGVFRVWIEDEIPDESDTFREIGEDFMKWFHRLYSQPDSADDTAWVPSQLEYNFRVMARKGDKLDISLLADQYYSGSLDWYSFNYTTAGRPVETEFEPDLEVISFLPSPVYIKGMPVSRFWEMEEGETNFGNISAGTTGLLDMLLAEFGLIYSNDWMVFPYKLPVNTLCKINGIIVTDVFGDRILIQPAGEGPDADWQRWAMYSLSNKFDFNPSNNYFFLPPTLTKHTEGEPIEEVRFIRDEMANMAWGIETKIPSPLGRGIRGKEHVIANDQQAEEDFRSTASIRYLLGTKVPENWIPFIPVHKVGSITEIQFQRAQLPKNGSIPPAEGVELTTIKPQGIILTEVKEKYFINEEEIPKSGIIVQRSYQRTRWFNGKTYLWIGRKKAPGRGQGSSGLAFDQIKDIVKKVASDNSGS